MVDSGIDWVPVIPAEWSVVRAKYVLRKLDRRFEPYDMPLVCTNKAEVVVRGEDSPGLVSPDEMNYQGVRAGDLLIHGMDTWHGAIAVSKLNGKCTTVVHVCGSNQDKRFLCYYCRALSFQGVYKLISNGIRQNTSDFRSFAKFGVIPTLVPPIDEQRRIADYLDERCDAIDEARRTIEAEIDALRRLRKAEVTKAVTKGLSDGEPMQETGIKWMGAIPQAWTISRLGYECYIRARLGWRGLKADEYVDDGYAFISAFNIQNSKLVWSPLNFISKERFDESPEIKIQAGDVLLVKDGAGVGKSARVEELPLGGTAPNSSIAVLTPYEHLNYRYLQFYLQSSAFDTFVSLLYNGMGVPHLTQEITRGIKLPLPPIKDQKRIADFLDERCAAIDSIIDTRSRQLERLEDYRKALICAYATGKKEALVS